jgi:hypothetical protein
VPGYANPQALNRYSYVLGNPLKYIDPTGHMVACEDGDVCDHGYPSSPVPSSPSPNDPNDPTDDVDDPNPNSLPAPISSEGTSDSPVEYSYCNGYWLFNCAIELPNWNLPPIDLFFISMRMVGQQTLIYGYNSDSPLTVGPGYVSLGGTEISYDGIEANLSGPSFAYIGANANIQVSTFSGSSMSTEPPFGMPMVSQHVGTSIEIITEALYFSEDIRIEFSGRPVETAVIPVLYYLYQSGLVLQRDFILLRDFGYYYETLPLR